MPTKFETPTYETEFILTAVLKACCARNRFYLILVNISLQTTQNCVAHPELLSETTQNLIQKQHIVICCLFEFVVHIMFMKQNSDAIINQVQCQEQLVHVTLVSIIIIFDSK